MKRKENKILELLISKDGYLYRIFTDGSWDRYKGEKQKPINQKQVMEDRKVHI